MDLSCWHQIQHPARYYDWFYTLSAVQSLSLPVDGIIPFTYKNLSLGILIDYKFGGTVLTSTLLNMTRQGHCKLSLEGREGGYIFPGV